MGMIIMSEPCFRLQDWQKKARTSYLTHLLSDFWRVFCMHISNGIFKFFYLSQCKLSMLLPSSQAKTLSVKEKHRPKQSFRHVNVEDASLPQSVFVDQWNSFCVFRTISYSWWTQHFEVVVNDSCELGEGWILPRQKIWIGRVFCTHVPKQPSKQGV